MSCLLRFTVSYVEVAGTEVEEKATKTQLSKLQRDRGGTASRYRGRVDWTARAFSALGEDAKAADAGGQMVQLSPDGRPDVVNGTDDGGLMAIEDVPIEAIIGVSVAFVLLAIIMLVSSLVVVVVVVVVFV